MQLKGKVNINDDVGLEKEADVMGGKAIQLRVKPLGNDVALSKVNGNTIQRRVGFELEYSDVLVNGTNGAGPLSKANPLINDYGAFQMNVDELAAGLDLEFVISHVDEDSIRGRDTAIEAAKNAMIVHDKVYNAALAGKKFVPQMGFLPTIGFKRGAGKGCRLQATAGMDLIALAKISADKDLYTETKRRIDPDNRSGTVTQAVSAGSLPDNIMTPAYNRMKQFTTSLGLNKEIPPQYFEGWLRVLAVLAGHLVQVPVNTRLETGPYPKAAGGPLLNRSDYGLIFKILPPEIHSFLKKFAYTWSLYLLDIIDDILKSERPRNKHNPNLGSMSAENAARHNTHSSRDIIHRDSPVMTDNWNRLEVPDYSGGLRLTEWYTKIVRNEVDLLTRANYPGSQGHKDNLESMGGYGKKFDPPGTESPRNVSRPLFEFRRLNGVDTPQDVILQIKSILELVSLAHK